jgi:cell division septation protein DedD
MILGIFFALALLCAVFFGFGYSMGRHSAQAVASTGEAATSSDTTASKPAPGSLANRSIAKSPTRKEAADGDDAAASSGDSTPAIVVRQAPTNSAADARSDIAAQTPATSTIKPVSMPRPATATSAPPTPVPVPGIGGAIVQIAAVSHKEDADVLVDALKKRGYSVAIRQEPQDKLLHVQIGPFANKKDADAMKQRLLADGYNAIVK